MPQFGGDTEFDPGFQKRGRFDGPEEELSVPPATLRILVRQHDAGGIIGKARDPQNSHLVPLQSLSLFLQGGENIKRLRKLVQLLCVLCVC